MDAEAAEEEQFGPYLVYERLGVGGMATVHRALERGIEGFERIVALKRLLPHLAEDASFIKSFVREAKLASLLNHVNIVQIYELGRVAAEYFISMEYIEGRDVRRVLRHARKVTGPPAIHVTVGILLQLCEALDYAHAKCDDDGQPLKLVHRDISPSNLLITPAGHLKVIDFGIARAQSSQLRTQTGRVKGKLAYMAPEAVSAKELDARSDLWAVGVIAHELLTARPLFASKNEYQTLLKVQRGDIIAPSTFNQACPTELDAIVAKALARDPDERYANANELREALLDLRRQYSLQTGHRDIAGWLDWAFSVEVPAGFAGNTNEGTGGSQAFDAGRPNRTPRPATVGAERREEDEAVEIAWGGAEPEDNAGPILLDDIPDVSEKHLGVSPMLDLLSIDDIPAPAPTHGPIARAKTSSSRPALDESTIDEAVDIDLDTPPTDPMGQPIVHEQPPVRNTPPPPPRTTGRIPITKPGIVAPRRASSNPIEAIPPVESQPIQVDLRLDTRPRKRVSQVMIGQSIVERDLKSPKKAWKIITALLLAGAAATAVTLYATRGKDTVTPIAEGAATAAKKVGTLKFTVEPNDSTITIASGEGIVSAKHDGSPWSIELPPGSHSVTIEHANFKPYLVAVDLDVDDKQLLRVVLEPLGTNPTGEATLIVASTPDGLDVVIDGRATGQKTTSKVSVPPGPHQVALRQNGVEVWHASLVAKANTVSELNASIANKPKAAAAGESRIERNEPRPEHNEPRPEPRVEPRIDPVVQTPDAAAPAVVEKPAVPIAPLPPTPTPTPTPIAPTPVPVAPAPVAKGPLTVPPNKVTKLSGEVPHLSVGKTSDIPAMVAAKLCIDVAGKVTSVDILTKLERHAASDLIDAMRAWRYAPYKDAGAPASACFVATLKTK